MAGAGASSSSENTRTGHPSARQVGTTALLIVVLVLLGHGWALHGVAGLMGQLSDPPQPASQISSPLLTRTIVEAAPTPTPQPPQPLAAPARSPPPAPPPSLAAVPTGGSALMASVTPAPSPPQEEPLARTGPEPLAAPSSSAMPMAPASRPDTPPVEQPATPALSAVAEQPVPAREPVTQVPAPTPAPQAALPVPVPLPASVPVAAALDEPPKTHAAASPTSAAPPLRPLVWPGSVGLAYQLEINSFPLPARAELRWRHDGAQYEASLSLLSLLSISRSSKGAITPQGLEPLRYGEKITARGETAVHFQRDKGMVSFSNNKPSVPLLAGMQDEVSAFFQLAALLGGDPRRYPAGTELPLQTVDSRALRSIVFVVGAAQTLDLPGGRLQTLYLSHSEGPAFEGSRGSKGEIWVAPALDYVPVRIRITEPSGTTYDLRWSQTLAP